METVSQRPYGNYAVKVKYSKQLSLYTVIVMEKESKNVTVIFFFNWFILIGYTFWISHFFNT